MLLAQLKKFNYPHIYGLSSNTNEFSVDGLATMFI
jgi:hypothetical protein